MTAIVWFRRDLRVHEHPALRAALDRCERVVCVFCLDDRLLHGRHESGPRTQFLLECLHDLDSSLRDRGSGLVIRHGPPERELAELAQEVGATEVHFSADVTPFARERGQRVARGLTRAGIELRAHPGLTVIDEPGEVRTQKGKPQTVFTPYYEAWLDQPRRGVLGAPRKMCALPAKLARGRIPSLDSLGLIQEVEDPLPGGEAAGRKRMNAFLRDAVAAYDSNHDALGEDKTSRLSPYLRFGCVSPRELEDRLPAGSGPEAFRRQLAWRDFYQQVILHRPGNACEEHQERLLFRQRLAQCPASYSPSSVSTSAPALAADDTAGPAHVATVSFLASRAVPSGGFWVALAGGMALARVAHRRGAREGYGAAIAATLETVAIMGPARFGVPFTQALSAPLLGRMRARGSSFAAELLACGAIRMLSNTAGLAFFVFVIAGGLDAYAGTYDALAERIGLSLSEGGALIFSAAGLMVWGAFASWVQVGFYRRGLSTWADCGDAGEPLVAPARLHRGRFDPRAVAVAAAISFALLLSGTAWPLLGAVTAFLVLAWAASRADRGAVATGAALAGVLALGAFVFSMGGGLGLDEAVRRALRAALLVAAATWLRAAAGSDGVREVSRRGLGRVRALPSAPEAARILDTIGSEGRLAAAGRTLMSSLGAAPMRPVEMMDAVLAWAAAEAGRFRSADPAPPLRLRARAVDGVLLLGAVAPGAALSL